MKNVLIFFYFLTLHADQLGITFFSFNFRLNHVVAILLLFFLKSFGQSLRLFMIDKKLAKPLIGISLAICISLIFNNFVPRALFFALLFFFTAIAYLFLPLCLMENDQEKIGKFYFLSFFLIGVYALMQLVLSFFGFQDPFCLQGINDKVVRPNAFAYEPSYYALCMTPFVFMANTLYILRSRLMNLALLMIVNALYIISTSTSLIFAYIIFGVIIFLFTFHSETRKTYPFLRKTIKKGLFFFFIFCLGFIFFFPFFSQEFLFKFFFKGLAHHSFYERWEGIKAAFFIFLEYPFFGCGLGNYPLVLMNKWQLGEYELFSRHDFLFVENPVKLFEASNMLTELCASLGLLGLGAFLSLLIVYMKSFQRAYIQKIDPETKALCLGFLVSLFVTLIVWQFNQGLFRSYIWVHFALGYGYFTQIIQNESQFLPELISAQNDEFDK